MPRHDDPRLADEEWLRAEFVDAGRSQRSLARELGMDPWTVKSALTRFGIELRPRTRFDRDEVRRLYVDERLSLMEVGRRVGASETGVRRCLDLMGVERRPRTQVRRVAFDPVWLSRRYVDEGATPEAIAAEAGCGKRTVYRRLEEAGIKRRRRGWRKGSR